MNILVMGGAAYIGPATAEALIKAGHSVTMYDSLVTGHRGAVPKSAQLIEAGESMKHPGRFYQNNLMNSLALMEAAVRAGVKRFVLSSTAAVFQSSDEPLTEDSPLGPTNVYGHTKLMVEQALEGYES